MVIARPVRGLMLVNTIGHGNFEILFTNGETTQSPPRLNLRCLMHVPCWVFAQVINVFVGLESFVVAVQRLQLGVVILVTANCQ